MIDDAIAGLRAGRDLSRAAAARAVGEIMDGRVGDVKIAAFLTAMAIKGETAAELAGAAAAMRKRVRRVRAPRGRVVDTCGTGGDGAGTFNISTLAGLVVAAAGVTVAKHGNRAASSRCGSADLLEALGVRIDLSPREMERCLRRVGFAFLMAPTCHPAMRHAAPVRRELGFRTIFNLVGPVSNPAFADTQTVGVYSWEHARLLARALRVRRAFVFHGDGTDELTPCGTNRVIAVPGFRTFTATARDFGVKRCRLDDLAGGSPRDNAAIAMRVLRGKPGPPLDTVAMNAGAALVAAGRARSFRDGAARARELLASGAALRKLDALRAF